MGSAEDRYWAKVLRAGVNECWLWTGATQNGYGIFWSGEKYPNGTNKMVKAHRWAYATFIAPPGSLKVLHRCDVRACQNPADWFLGTIGDNNRDRSKKGRSFTGPRKLTPAQVEELRTRYGCGGVSQTTLAKEYGISQTGVSLLLRS